MNVSHHVSFACWIAMYQIKLVFYFHGTPAVIKCTMTKRSLALSLRNTLGVPQWTR